MSRIPEAVSDGIRVQVETEYLPGSSDPGRNRWVFAYQVTLTNEGQDAAQLLSRHWIITDAEGRIEEVRGPGVVGETPLLEPGESFSYTSFCPLPTDQGRMEGTYQMARPDGSTFEARIPLFELEVPYTVN